MIFQVGESPRFTDTIVDEDGDPADPTTIKIYIRKPDYTLSVDNQTPTMLDVGIYYYDHTITAQVGKHTGKFVCTGSSGRVSIHPFEFEVVESFEA